MFSSGYADTNFTTSNNTALVTTFVSRVWRIIRFDINVEMQYFESDVENIILN